MPLGSSLTIRPLTSRTQLEEFVPLWEDLLRRGFSDEPMMSPTWILSWWDIYGKDREIQAAAWERNGTPIGAALLHRRISRYRLGYRFRRLEPLGSEVEEGDGVCTEYSNLLAAAGEETEVAKAFVDALGGGAFGRWEEWTCDGMDAAHPMTVALEQAFADAGWRVQRDARGAAPYIRLPASWDELIARYPKKRRYDAVSALRDFHAWAGGEVRVRRVETLEDLRQAQPILHELHRERWRAEGAEGMFVHPRFRAFHDRVQAALREQGKLELAWTEVKGEPVAVHYSIAANGKVYFYQTGRKIGVPRNVRLGIVQVIFAVQRAIEQGLREFDFLGGQAQYKAVFATDLRPLVRLRVARTSIKEVTFRSLRWTAAQVRKWRGRTTGANGS